MNLDIKEYTLEQCIGDVFGTITLPKQFLRKGMAKQYDYIKQYVSKILSNFFTTIHGVIEFTGKGNIHFHFIGDIKDPFETIKFVDTKAYNIASCKYIATNLRKISIVDIQPIKDKNNVFKYMMKDKDVSQAILKHSPFITGKPKKEPISREPLPECSIEEATRIMDNNIKQIDRISCNCCYDNEITLET